jgi:hypothetical protein
VLLEHISIQVTTRGSNLPGMLRNTVVEVVGHGMESADSAILQLAAHMLKASIFEELPTLEKLAIIQLTLGPFSGL